MRSSFNRVLALGLTVYLAIGHAFAPIVTAAEDGYPTGANKRRLTQAEMVLSATFFGAGVALATSSFLVEEKYEKDIIYYDSDGDRQTQTIRGGSDTDTMLIIGAGLVFIGACFAVFPQGNSGEDSTSDNEERSENYGFQLQAPAIQGQVVAVGVSHGF